MAIAELRHPHSTNGQRNGRDAILRELQVIVEAATVAPRMAGSCFPSLYSTPRNGMCRPYLGVLDKNPKEVAQILRDYLSKQNNE